MLRNIQTLPLLLALAALGCGEDLPEPWKTLGLPDSHLDEVPPGSDASHFTATYSSGALDTLASFEESLSQNGFETCGERVRDPHKQNFGFTQFFLKAGALHKLRVLEVDGDSLVSFSQMDLGRGYGNDLPHSGCELPGYDFNAHRKMHSLPRWSEEERAKLDRTISEFSRTSVRP